MKLEQNYKVDIVELKKIMVEQNLDKIIDLSIASTVDRNTLSKIINGDAKPSTTVIEKLMSTLHIPPEKAGAIFFSLNLRNT
ncbi:helix-turn-helix domain-containing protein [Parablautia intestinalis]|uniref:helix-turn-helix domain-containing protein n=1 Tax=Parablautia intestinalis TaxID=2320100 RepID=UPI00256F2FDD|nr:helix-turn-helix transcriptional regulator [Parablautia intestinalis]